MLTFLPSLLSLPCRNYWESDQWRFNIRLASDRKLQLFPFCCSSLFFLFCCFTNGFVDNRIFSSCFKMILFFAFFVLFYFVLFHQLIIYFIFCCFPTYISNKTIISHLPVLYFTSLGVSFTSRQMVEIIPRT